MKLDMRPPHRTNGARSSRHGSLIFLALLSALPFIGLCIHTFVWPEYRNYGVRALIAYAALVLSFAGAVHCGLALGRGIGDKVDDKPGHSKGKKRQHFSSLIALMCSPLPMLLAWCSLLLMPQAARYWLLLGFLLSLAVDIVLLRSTPSLRWYLCLRSGLTLVAIIALALARMAPAAGL